ncbi:MAG: DNA mismatch repair protein MutS [Hyphomicrobiales bacterium]|nr:MAG: DNA mismatch repair protein MutS [Hyphomicrobiales bacterium]
MSHGVRKGKAASEAEVTASDGEAAPVAKDPAPPPGVTPSMAQFLEIKTANPDCLLFYRMGDFYELFFEDAVAAAEALGIVLTKRGKHLGEDIPMCGVPIHRSDEYLQRLIAKGFRVAVCEQLEDPAEAKKRGSKAVVKRDVVRLVTPGTLTEDSLLDARTRNYLTAMALAGKGAAATIALASLDISTGEFEVGEIAASDFPGEIVRLAPGEVLAADTALGEGDIAKWIEIAGAAATPVPAPSFDALAGTRLVKEQLGVADLAAFGTFSKAELSAIGALLKYVDLTQLGARPPLRPPRRSGSNAHLVIDAPSRASLELVRSASGDKKSSLLGAIDRTVTGAGARELAARLASPLRDAALINLRLDDVELLATDETLRDDARALLRRAPDLARAVSRLSLKRGSPRDLGAVRDALRIGEEAGKLLAARSGGIGLPDGLVRIARALAAPSRKMRDDLVRAIVEDPPHLRRDGGFVREGYRADLDQARALRDDSRQVMAGLEARYVEATSVRALKVRHNNILGYYIEVPAGSAKPLQSEPHVATFRHRQTMAGAVRFTTDELVETEGRIVSAADRSLAIEQEVFEDLAARIAAESAALADLAQGLADLDCEAALADLAVREGYVRPHLSDDAVFDIRGGRHPVVEQALKAQKAQAFIANDCVLGASRPEVPDGFDEETEARLWLVTGPNMAGKSTFLRQNALIAVMAQMGSFVPAASAHVGLVDRLFSRVGASDDLARGRSTFMVEMVETAAILNQASERSLVILDEIGRGTATYDGLSIAWAVVEYLHDVSRCRALFATHYHELTALAQRLSGVANVSMDVREWRDEIVFLHKVKAGAADRSYGIQVGKLAGLPKAVTRRAKQVLERLEKERGKTQSGEALIEELPLFAPREEQAPHAAAQPAEPSPLQAALAAIDPDDLTPKAALEALYRLKALATGGEDC